MPLTDSNGKWILNDKKAYYDLGLKYEVDEQKIIIQDYSAGHTFGQGGI